MSRAPDSVAPKSRRERERERHRQEILEAARQVVEARGLSGLTVDEVARQAEFAVGSIYRHFRSKEELLEVLVVHLAEPLGDEIEAIAAGPGPFEQQLRASVSTVLSALAEHIPLMQAFANIGGPMPGPESPARQHLDAVKNRWIEAIASVLRNGQAAGEVADGDARVNATLLLALVAGVARARAQGAPPFAEDPADAVCRLVLDGLRRR